MNLVVVVVGRMAVYGDGFMAHPAAFNLIHTLTIHGCHCDWNYSSVQGEQGGPVFLTLCELHTPAGLCGANFGRL